MECDDAPVVENNMAMIPTDPKNIPINKQTTAMDIVSVAGVPPAAQDMLEMNQILDEIKEDEHLCMMEPKAIKHLAMIVFMHRRGQWNQEYEYYTQVAKKLERMDIAKVKQEDIWDMFNKKQKQKRGAQDDEEEEPDLGGGYPKQIKCD